MSEGVADAYQVHERSSRRVLTLRAQSAFVVAAAATLTFAAGSHDAHAAPKDNPGVEVSLPGGVVEDEQASPPEAGGNDRDNPGRGEDESVAVPISNQQEAPNREVSEGPVTLPGGVSSGEAPEASTNEGDEGLETEAPAEDTSNEPLEETPDEQDKPVTLPGGSGTPPIPRPIPAPEGNRPEESEESQTPVPAPPVPTDPPNPSPAPGVEMVGDVQYYNQHDEPWAGEYYAGGGNGNMDNNGCGPTTLAMAISSLSDHDVTPTAMAQALMALGSDGVTENGSTVHGGMVQVARNHGLEADFLANEDDLQAIDQITENGGLVITNGRDEDPATPATPGGHVIGIRDVDGGLIYLYDSNSRENSQKGFTPEQIFGPSRIGYYIMPPQQAEAPPAPAPSSAEIENVSFDAVLDVIAEGESHGNYNAYYGNVSNKSVPFTEMTVAEVLQWQESYVAGGSPSSAVGRYQFIRDTLSGLVQEMNIDPGTRFDEQLQDRLALQLLIRRGALEFINGQISREEFAARLAMEWASLPRITGPNPEQSYYAGDGLNAAHISVDQILGALSQLKA